MEIMVSIIQTPDAASNLICLINVIKYYLCLSLKVCDWVG